MRHVDVKIMTRNVPQKRRGVHRLHCNLWIFCLFAKSLFSVSCDLQGRIYDVCRGSVVHVWLVECPEVGGVMGGVSGVGAGWKTVWVGWGGCGSSGPVYRDRGGLCYTRPPLGVLSPAFPCPFPCPLSFPFPCPFRPRPGSCRPWPHPPTTSPTTPSIPFTCIHQIICLTIHPRSILPYT